MKKLTGQDGLTNDQWSLLERVFVIAHAVGADARKGSDVARAFALFAEEADSDRYNLTRMLRLAIRAWDEWRKVPAELASMILGGWHAPKSYPTMAQFRRDSERYGEGVQWCLHASGGTSGEVHMEGEFSLDDGRAGPVAVKIKLGTSKADAVAALARIAAALVEQWPAAIATNGGGVVVGGMRELDGGIFEQVNVEQRRAEPYNAQGRKVERMHRTLRRGGRAKAR